jgi:phosphoglycolate phosphatase
MNDKVLFIDLDGTIIDSSDGVIASMEYAMSVCGVTSYSRLQLEKTLIGPPLYEGLKRLTALPDDRIDVMIKQFRKHYDEYGVMQNRLYVGMFETIATLHRLGYTLHILTSKPQRFAERIVQQHKLDPFFTMIMGAGETDRSTSKPFKIERYLKEKMVQKHNCLMIGDRMDDIQAAALNGIESIAVVYGFGHIDELMQIQPSILVEKPTEIVEAVKKILEGAK